MSGEAHWSTEQPNWGDRHVRNVGELNIGMIVKLHLRVGAEDKTTMGEVSEVDTEREWFKLHPNRPWFRLVDYGVVPSTTEVTEVWSRHNWIERIG